MRKFFLGIVVGLVVASVTSPLLAGDSLFAREKVKKIDGVAGPYGLNGQTWVDIDFNIIQGQGSSITLQVNEKTLKRLLAIAKEAR